MSQPRRLDLRSLLTRAEAAAPVGVVDAMAGALLEMLGARDVSFLIADFSGGALSRLAYADDAETARPVSLTRTPGRGARGPALRGAPRGRRHAGARAGHQPRRSGRGAGGRPA